ncbi:hypothetical protein BH10BAC5_BH10BAC5_22490 [soil metagenome]
MIILILFFAMLISNSTFAQDDPKNCCSEVSATGKFAALGSLEEFRDDHTDPLKFEYKDQHGTMETYSTPDGKTTTSYIVRSKERSNKYILVFHEWYGLNDYIKKESDELAENLMNVNVIAVDLYDGNVAANSNEAAKLMQSLTETRATSIINGASEYAGSDAVLGTVGWCFGGGWSLQAALMLPDKVKMCVMYYGMPEQNIEKLMLLNAKLLAFYGTRDKHLTPEVVNKFKSDLDSLGKPYSIYSYDAGHGFANPSNPVYDASATADAKEKMYKFFLDL